MTTNEFQSVLAHGETLTVEFKSDRDGLPDSELVETHGSGRVRDYTLSATFYRCSRLKAAYVRQAAFDPIQREQMVLKYVRQHGLIKRSDVMDLCRISPDQAAKLLAKLKKDKRIKQQGTKKGAIYVLGSNV
jgi:ATP-dependent DNA helicase RecG